MDGLITLRGGSLCKLCSLEERISAQSSRTDHSRFRSLLADFNPKCGSCREPSKLGGPPSIIAVNNETQHKPLAAARFTGLEINRALSPFPSFFLSSFASPRSPVSFVFVRRYFVSLPTVPFVDFYFSFTFTVPQSTRARTRNSLVNMENNRSGKYH